MPHGYNAFVLYYSVQKGIFPKQLIEASWAIKHIKDNAGEYGIDAEQVFAVGFSAGGHLAGTLGTMWNNPDIYKAIDMPMGYNKPKGVMLIYPVVSGNEVYGHIGSFKNLFMKDEPTKAELDMVSVEKFADETSSAMFIMHTSNDRTVDVRNSLVLAEKLASEGVKFELHVYPDAPHGVALANEITSMKNPKHENPQIAKWIEQAAFWAENL